MELFAFPGLVVLALAIPGFVALVAAVYVAVWYLRTVVFARKPQPLAPLPGSQQRHVVITGCDTGLGRTLAEIFAGKSGYFVHALCLSKAAAQELDATSDSIHGVVCDVTNDQQVTAAVDAVSHSTTSVWALINNAGVSGGVEAEFTSLDTIQRVMNVNYFGSIRVALAFLPLLKANGTSRVIQMGSAAGRCSIGGVTCYGSSKAAICNWMSTFAVEQSVWGVSVAVIEPSHVKTPMLERIVANIRRVYDQLPEATKEAYGMKYLKTRIGVAKWKVAHADDPDVVLSKVVDGVTLDEPLPVRNLVGSASKKLRRLEWMSYQTQFEAMAGMFHGQVLPATIEKLRNASKDE